MKIDPCIFSSTASLKQIVGSVVKVRIFFPDLTEALGLVVLYGIVDDLILMFMP